MRAGRSPVRPFFKLTNELRMKDIDEDAELKLWGQAEGEMEIGKYEILLLVFFLTVW